MQGWGRWAYLTLVFVSWYGLSAVCTKSAKDYLDVSKLPAMLTLAEFVFAIIAGSLLQGVQLLFSSYVWPNTRRSNAENREGGREGGWPSFSVQLLPALFNFGLFYFSNLCLAHLNIALEQTVKAGEPITSIFASYLILGERFRSWQVVPAVITVAGIILTTATNLTAEVFGVTVAMLANISLSLRNVYAKKVQRKREEERRGVERKEEESDEEGKGGGNVKIGGGEENGGVVKVEKEEECESEEEEGVSKVTTSSPLLSPLSNGGGAEDESKQKQRKEGEGRGRGGSFQQKMTNYHLLNVWGVMFAIIVWAATEAGEVVNQAQAGSHFQIEWRLLLTVSWTFYVYNAASYLFLSLATPLSHSMANSFRRVVVIILSKLIALAAVQTGGGANEGGGGEAGGSEEGVGERGSGGGGGDASNLFLHTVGIALSTAGVLAYSLAQARASKR